MRNGVGTKRYRVGVMCRSAVEDLRWRAAKKVGRLAVTSRMIVNVEQMDLTSKRSWGDDVENPFLGGVSENTSDNSAVARSVLVVQFIWDGNLAEVDS
jgi:hypothetical protein